MNYTRRDFLNCDDFHDDDEFLPQPDKRIDPLSSFGDFEEEFDEYNFEQDLRPIQPHRSDQKIFSTLLQSESEATFQTNESQFSKKANSLGNGGKAISISSTFESQSVNFPDSLNRKSKKISKQEESKKDRKKSRVAKITEETIFSGEVPSKYIPDGFTESNLDDKERKKLLQMVRNRIAAQQSRDKKKNQMHQLEEKQRIISEDNMKLMNKIKQLEEANVLLHKENGEFKKALTDALSHKTENIIPSDVLQNDFGRASNAMSSQYEVQQNRENAERATMFAAAATATAGNSSGTGRQRAPRSGGMMKYSMTLATFFTILMFTGISPPMQMSNSNILTNVTEQTTLQDAHTQMYSSKAEMFRNNQIQDKTMYTSKKDLMRSKFSGTDPNNFGKQNKMISEEEEEVRGDKYIGRYFNPYKFVEPMNFRRLPEPTQHQKKSDEMEYTIGKNQWDLPSYVKSGRDLHPFDSRHPIKDHLRELLEEEAKPFDMKQDKYSSLFSPAGFEYRLNEGEPRMEEEQPTNENPKKRQLNLRDAEYLQMFIPRNNISLATTTAQAQNDLSIATSQQKPCDENSIFEIWNQLFSVKELPFGSLPFN